MESPAFVVILVVSSLVALLVIGFLFWSQRGLMSAAAVDYHALARTFMERTGFRLAEMPDAPLDEQVRVVVARQSDPVSSQQGYEMNYVLRKYGKLVQYQTWTQLATMRSSWSVPLAQPPRVGFHVLKATKAEPAYPHRVRTGDPRWDADFEIYGEDPPAVQQAMGASGLLELLESCVAVDLRVLGDQVVFRDPTNRNVNAALGGRMGVAMAGSDPAKMMEMTIPIYNHITDVVLLAAEASQ